MARRSGVRLDKERMQARLDRLNDRMNNGIAAAFEYQAPKSEARMKSTARWTDRTGNARAGLFTKTSHTGNHHELLLSHLMSYGIFLEVRFSGRYAIVIPEIRLAAQDLQRLIRKILAAIPER